MMTIQLNKLYTIGCLLLSASWDVDGQNLRSGPQYRVRAPAKSRDLQTPLSPFDMLLSYSDDGAEREDEFFLDIFDTPEILTNSASPMVISKAMNFFLLQELNDKFDELNLVEKVSSEIVHLKTRNSTFVNASGIEANRIGTEARMRVTLTFEQTPSPATEDVEIVLKWIMSDLSYFVTNLTSAVSDDNELKGVYIAIRREIRSIPFVQPPGQGIIVEATGEGSTPVTRAGNMLVTAMPIIVGVALLAAVIVFFVFRKKSKPKEPESVKDSEMMYDIDNEVYSMDRSVQSAETKSPSAKLEHMPEDLSSIQYSMSADSGLQSDTNGDSIFSGISADQHSAISPKSLLTGFTCASASTIQASNTQNNHYSKRTKSPVGGNSVFNFLDPIEDADEETVDDVELMERNKSVTNGDISQYAKDSTGGTNQSVNSILDGVSINLPLKSKDEDRAILADLAEIENLDTSMAAPRDPTPTNVPLPAEKKNETDATPRTTGTPDMEEVKDKNSSKASKSKDGYKKDVASSPPDSPMQQVGRHWLTSSGKKTSRRLPESPKAKIEVDYDQMLSQPSPIEGESVDSRELNDTINDSMQIVDRAPQEYYPHGGRRHAGDKIGGDGSAFYQTSAMKPTDWSVKSSDAGSIGSSTLDDEPSPNMARLTSQSQKSVSASRQLINDLVWLEQKISTVRGGTKLTRSDDSLLYDSSEYSSFVSDKDPSNIVCRDCIAPPGRLNIVIHSTKDGPAIHAVKDGSSLEGEVFPGDLIISVDNIDTRTSSAEEVMTMMAARGDQERKITVLRFLQEA